MLTDFGLEGNFSGVIKGVMASVNRRLTVIDITHCVPQGDILHGAFLLKSAYRFFPEGTVFLAVVDPGVGSARRRLLIETRHYCFVGPDNGVVSLAASEDGIQRTYALENKRFFSREVCPTFEARDVFAPLAALRASGRRGIYRYLKSVPGNTIVTLQIPSLQVSPDTIVAEVLSIDHFGNMAINMDKSLCLQLLMERYYALVRKRRIAHFYSYYAEAPAHELFFTEGSFKCVEIAMKNKSAAESLQARVHDKVIFKKQDRS